MAQDNFARALAFVLRAEGGYANDPRDAGGPTFRGITLAVARAAWKADATADDLRRMPDDVVRAIYQRRYWDAVSGDALPAGLDLAVFDTAVNSGVVRALTLLRAALGLPAQGRAMDAPLAAALAACDVAATIGALCEKRLAFLRSLKRWPDFGAGWEKRVQRLRIEARAMAAEAKPKTAPKKTPAIAGTAAAGAAASGGVVAVFADRPALAVFGVIVLLIAAGTAAWLIHHHRTAQGG